MKKNTQYKTLALLGIFAILLGACGKSTQTPDPVISTAVALTVAAQNVQQSAPTSTAIPTATAPANITFPTPTQILFSTTPTKSGSTINTACARADFVSDDPPDGTIMKPGTVFTKTWQIKNSSSCTWDTTYKIIFWDGNVLGGAYYYNLPQAVAPEGVIDISLVLTAPAEEGTFTSEWMLQTSNNISFGVGKYNEPFWAKIVVLKTDKPDYKVTSVSYDVIRVPDRGCATGVRYTINATVTVNGPMKIKYRFLQKDDNNSNGGTIEFTEAGSKIVVDKWNFHLGSSPGEKWVQFELLEPYWQQFDKQYFSYLCGNTP